MLTTLAIFAAALGSGLMAGLFFIFSVCIMQALSRLPPEQGIAAMKRSMSSSRTRSSSAPSWARR